MVTVLYCTVLGDPGKKVRIVCPAEANLHNHNHIVIVQHEKLILSSACWCGATGAIIMMYTNSFADLPQEIRQSLEKASSDQYLEILSAAALDPANTHIIFARYDHLFVEFCGRWLSSVRAGKSHSLPVLSAVARVLPCARHLVVYLDEIIRTQLPSTSDDTHRDVAWKSLSLQPDLDPAALPEHQLVDLLLTAYRLLNFDNAAFAPSIAPSKLMPLLQHSSRPVRYLAICNLRSYLHAADFFMQSMVEKHLGNDSIEGQWEGKMIDFGFLA